MLFSAAWDHSLRLKRLAIRSQTCRWRICLPSVLLPWPRTTIAAVELPSCVTPLLAYYRFGSCAPPASVSEETDGRFWALSITGLGMGGSVPVREYQPVVHRLRLSASP